MFELLKGGYFFFSLVILVPGGSYGSLCGSWLLWLLRLLCPWLLWLLCPVVVKQKPLPLQQYFPRSSLQFTIQLVHPRSQRLLPALLPCLLNTWSCGPCFVQPPLAIFTSQCAIKVSQFLPCSVFKFLILSACFGCPSGRCHALRSLSLAGDGANAWDLQSHIILIHFFCVSTSGTLRLLC